MSTTTAPEPAILGFTRALGAALDKVAAGPDPIFLSAADKKHALVELSKQSERIEALRHRLLGVADDAAEHEAARSVAALAAHHTLRDYARLIPEADLARALEQRWHRTQTAWGQGRINRDQAKVIVEALDKLPDSVSPDQLVAAEEHLITLAQEWPPHGLRNLATHLWEVIAPEEAEQLEAEALAREEANARARDPAVAHTLRRRLHPADRPHPRPRRHPAAHPARRLLLPPPRPPRRRRSCREA
jgi:hypothetical protein